jgi:hypothetical protein
LPVGVNLYLTTPRIVPAIPMSESYEQVQLRKHLAEMRRAWRGVGKDFAIEFRQIDDKIARLGSLTAKEVSGALSDIQEDFSALGAAMDAEMRRLPGQVASGIMNAGRGVASGAVQVATATANAIDAAGHRAKQGTRNALAAAAGVNRRPMKQWHSPSEEGSRPSDDDD